ncbi:hypothetical protein ACFLUH_03350 [Chloroflexota bacterium]
MGENRDDQIPSEDPVAFYRPLIDELRRILDKYGEASTLQEFAHHPEFVKDFQQIYRLTYQHIEDVSKLSPELLYGHVNMGNITSYDIKGFEPLYYKQHTGFIDLGEYIPPAYVQWLIERPEPFKSFISDLLCIEIATVCSTELERRSLEHPELVEIENYKKATPKREAQKYLRERSLGERVHLADKYGLKILSQLESLTLKILHELSSLYEKGHGIEAAISEYPKWEYKATCDFPKFEKQLWAAAVKKSAIPEEQAECIEVQCDLLINAIAIDEFGLVVQKGYSPQTFEAEEAIVKIHKIVGTKGIARRYSNILDRGFKIPEDDEDKKLLAKTNSEIGAVEGLYEGIYYWANKEFEDIIISALEGKMVPSLKVIINHNLKDDTSKEKRHKKRQLLEMDYKGEKLNLIEYDGSGTIIKSQEGTSDELKEATPLFDRIPSYELSQEQFLEDTESKAIDLERLGFNKDDLTPRELLLLDEVSDAANKGYMKDSKDGLSLRQYWGKDYDRKMKMLKRLEVKRNKH